MSQLDLEAIKARLGNLVSEPPWEVRGEWATGATVYARKGLGIYALPGCINCGENDEAVYEMEDAKFIAHAPTDIASLVAEVERLKAELKQRSQFDDPKVAEDEAAVRVQAAQEIVAAMTATEDEAVAFMSADYRDGYTSALAALVNIADRIGSGGEEAEHV